MDWIKSILSKIKMWLGKKEEPKDKIRMASNFVLIGMPNKGSLLSVNKPKDNTTEIPAIVCVLNAGPKCEFAKKGDIINLIEGVALENITLNGKHYPVCRENMIMATVNLTDHERKEMGFLERVT